MKQIFILEDDRGIRELIQYLLQKQKYLVQSFATVEEFNQGIAIQQPDLILMDIMLPDGSGLEACQHITEDPDTSEIPVILMSAHADTSRLDEVGAKDLITKPFDVDDFLERINLQLQ